MRVLRKHCFRGARKEANKKSDQRGMKRIRSNIDAKEVKNDKKE